MGKAARKKKGRTFQTKSISESEGLLESGEISTKPKIFRSPILHIILIALVGIIIYSGSFNSPFHFDDGHNILENQRLRDLNNFWPPSGSRWTGFLTFALNYHFGGLNTAGYHVVNLIIHIFNAILVYWLVILIFKTPYFMVRQAHNDTTVTLILSKGYLPLFSALLFIAHPIQTQAVTYIVQRFTSLATMFYLLSLVMYIKFRSQQSATSSQQKLYAVRYTLYAVSLISAIFAMKTKEIAFTLPVIIVLFEFMFFEGKIKKRILHLIPMLLTMLIIPLSLIGTDKPVGDAIGELREAAQGTEEIPRWSYLFTQFRVVVTYIRLLFLPTNQNLDYDYPIYHSFFKPDVFLSFVFLFIIFALGVYLFYTKRHTLTATRLIAFGIFWFFITFSVESSIIPIRDVINEHRIYLPSVGAIVASVAAVFYAVEIFKKFLTKRHVSIFLCVVVFIFSIATYERNIVWNDELSLWGDVAKKSPNKIRGHNNLGLIYYENNLSDKAIEQYQLALRLKPDNVEVHNNLGNAYLAKGMIDEAIEYYKDTLRLNSSSAETHNNLAVIYRNKDMIDKAVEHIDIAVRIRPDSAEIFNTAGNIYSDRGQRDRAIEYYKKAIDLKPDFAEAHYNLGIEYRKKGLIEKAIKEFRITLQIDPNFTGARQNLEFLSKQKM